MAAWWAFGLLFFGVAWWVVVRGYELHFRQAPRPLPWVVYLPAIVLVFVPVCLALAAVAGPVLAIPRRYRSGLVGVGVWLLYPALAALGLWICGLDLPGAALLAAGVLLLSRGAMRERPWGSQLFVAGV